MSALTRPAYHVRVRILKPSSNATAWSIETAQGAAPDHLDAAVVLRDDLTAQWGLDSGQAPGPLEPVTCTFALAAATAADLPALNIGETVIVTATRPLPDGGAATYFEASGTITDPRLSLDPHNTRRPVVAQVTITGENLEARKLYIYNASRRAVGTTPPARIDAMLSLFPTSQVVYPSYVATSDAPLEPMADMISYGEHLTALGVSVPYATGSHRSPSYPRVAHNNNTLTLGNGWTGRRFSQETTEIAAGAVTWLIPQHSYLGARSAGLTLTTVPSDTGPVMTVTNTAAGDPDAADIAVLTGHHVTTPAAAVKSLATFTDSLTVQTAGLTDSGSEAVPIFYDRDQAVSDRSSPGKRPREVETVLVTESSRSDLPATATAAQRRSIGLAFLTGPIPDPAEWAYPTLEVSTWTMTDAELDNAAPQFCPQLPQSGQHINDVITTRQIVITDPAERVRTTNAGRAIAAQIVGATFTISGGRLSIAADLIPGTQRHRNVAGSDVEVSAADLRDRPQFEPIDANHTDKSLDAAIFRLVKAPD